MINEGSSAKTMYKKESKSVGSEEEDSLNQVGWKVGVGEIAVGMG